MNLFESINKGFEAKYGDLDSKKEKKVTKCDSKHAVSEGVNTKLCTRADARDMFEKGGTVYAGLKDGKSLYGFKKDGETPTFNDVVKYVSDDFKIKSNDIQWAVDKDSVKESCNKDKKEIKESLKLIMDIGDYHPWSGAVDTFDKIQDADMVGALEDYLEDIYPEGLTVTELNDILWFDGDTVLRDLGLSDEEEDEDEDEEDIDESCKKSVKEGRSIDFKKLHRCKK